MRNNRVDLLVIGGGINGAGIAADAAGRGLTVMLVEKSDLASATSSASSKLIHGGLRYLEYFEFRLVREALAEREILLAAAPHIIWPLRFILPETPGGRSHLKLRAGLFLYDHLAKRRVLPRSGRVDLARDCAREVLAPSIERALQYSDCWVDDARLVVLNARAAANKGAIVRTRTEVVRALRDGAGWRVSLSDRSGLSEVEARAVVNAAGPWAGDVARMRDTTRNAPGIKVRLVKGSHIVVRRRWASGDAFLMQSTDGRVVFALPFERDFTLIGTTDVPFDGDPSGAQISDDEERYLIAVANGFLRLPIARDDIVWRYAGVRPLFDDEADNPSAVSRDYKLVLAADDPPWLDVAGGKITTYRRLAESAMDMLAAAFPSMGRALTASATLPGGDLGDGGFEGFVASLARRRPGFLKADLLRLVRRYGTLSDDVLGDAKRLADMGQAFGAGLTERETVYLRDNEWAETPDDVLWRRTKSGLHLSPPQRQNAAVMISGVL